MTTTINGVPAPLYQFAHDDRLNSARQQEKGEQYASQKKWSDCTPIPEADYSHYKYQPPAIAP